MDRIDGPLCPKGRGKPIVIRSVRSFVLAAVCTGPDIKMTRKPMITTNEELGLDPALAAATDAKREEAVNVDAPATEDPVGLPDQPNETAPMTAVAVQLPGRPFRAPCSLCGRRPNA